MLGCNVSHKLHSEPVRVSTQYHILLRVDGVLGHAALRRGAPPVRGLQVQALHRRHVIDTATKRSSANEFTIACVRNQRARMRAHMDTYVRIYVCTCILQGICIFMRICMYVYVYAYVYVYFEFFV